MLDKRLGGFMATLIKRERYNLDNADPQTLSISQLQVIKAKAIQIWGPDKWMAQINKQYCAIAGRNERTSYAQTQRYFKEENPTMPTLETLNILLLAVDCRLKITSISIEELN
jgi:hypothetical protein